MFGMIWSITTLVRILDLLRCKNMYSVTYCMTMKYKLQVKLDTPDTRLQITASRLGTIFRQQFHMPFR